MTPRTLSAWGAVLLLLAASRAATADDDPLLTFRLRTSPTLSQYAGTSRFNAHLGLDADVRLSTRLSLRPKLGFGWSGSEATGGHVGGLLFFHPSIRSPWQPYIGTGLAYRHRSSATGTRIPGAPAPPGPIGANTISFLGAIGIRRPLGGRVGMFAEIGTAYTPNARYRYSTGGWYRPSGWQADVPLRSAFGLTLDVR